MVRTLVVSDEILHEYALDYFAWDLAYEELSGAFVLNLVCFFYKSVYSGLDIISKMKNHTVVHEQTR